MESRGTHWRSTTYAPSSRTYPGDIHFDDMRVLMTHVFSWRAYVFAWRTWSDDVRILRLRVPVTYAFCLAYVFRWRTCLPATYVFYRCTHSIHVRILSTYVCYRRTCATDVRIRDYALEIEIRDYAVELEDSGLPVRRSRIRDYAISGLRSRNHGFGTTLIPSTQNILDSGSGWRRSPWTY